jgi:lipopolysaccharide export system protein LptC
VNDALADTSASVDVQHPGFPAREQLRASRPARMRAIRVLKVLLTALAAVLIGLLALWPQLRSSTDRLRIAFADFDVTSDDLSMMNARYVGTDGNNRPFSVTADAARQRVPGKGKLQLESPQADIHLQDGSWVMVTADKGEYNPDDRVLNVAGEVRLFHDSGYEFLSKEANSCRSFVWNRCRSPVKPAGAWREWRSTHRNFCAGRDRMATRALCGRRSRQRARHPRRN